MADPTRTAVKLKKTLEELSQRVAKTEEKIAEIHEMLSQPSTVEGELLSLDTDGIKAAVAEALAESLEPSFLKAKKAKATETKKE